MRFFVFSVFFANFLFSGMTPLNSAAVDLDAPAWKHTGIGLFTQADGQCTTHVIQVESPDKFAIEAVLIIPEGCPETTNCIALIESHPRAHLDLNTAKARATQFKKPFIYLFPRGSRLLDDSYPTESIKRIAKNDDLLLKENEAVLRELFLEIEREAFGDYGGKHIDDLGTLLEAAQFFIKGKFIVYGGSLGGYMAVQALLNPNTKGLFAAGVSVSGFYSLDTTKFTDKIIGPLIPESYVTLNIREHASLPPAALKRRAHPVDVEWGIDVPLLVIHGEDDYTTLCCPQGARSFAERHGCAYVEIPGATHENITDDPNFMPTLGAFLARVDAQQKEIEDKIRDDKGDKKSSK